MPAMYSDRKKMQEYLPKEAYKAVVDATEKAPLSAEKWPT